MKLGSLTGRLGTCVLIVSTGCATVAPRASVRPIDPGLMIGKVAEPTSFERRDDPLTPEDPAETRKKQRARTISFWTGVGILGVGGAGLVGFGATGAIIEHRISKGYEDGSLTRSDEQRYDDIGDASNTGMIVTGVVALVGLTMASLVFAIDYTKCGKLAKRRKNCPRRR